MSNLKKIVRKEIKESVKKNSKTIITESKIIGSRFKILTEGRKFNTDEDVDKLVLEIVSEINYLKSQKFNNQLIQEGFFDFLKGVVGEGPSGIWDYIQQRFANWVLDKFGMPPGFLRNVISDWFSHTPFSQMSKLLTDCHAFSGQLGEAIAEAYVQKMQHAEGLDGAFYGVLRNAIIDEFKNKGWSDMITNVVAKIICPVLGGLTNKLAAAETDIKNKVLSPNQSVASNTSSTTPINTIPTAQPQMGTQTQPTATA